MRVAVLLSSFQGEKYITEQIQSVLSQLPEDGRLIIRDDGSTDETVKRIEAFEDMRISVTRGENCGFVKSFFILLRQAPEDADVVMLCDQDDVWLPNKIQRATDHLKDFNDQPALYCSRLRLVDANLSPIGLSPKWPHVPSFKNALAENIVTGCTAALNRPALKLVIQYGDAQKIFFHDWWLYLVTSAFGTVIFDPIPTILYRQHGRNAIGMGSGFNRYLTILKFITKKSWVEILLHQISNFEQVFSTELSQKNHDYVNRYFKPENLFKKINLIFGQSHHRQRFLDDFLLRILFFKDLFICRIPLSWPKPTQ
jgi:glycosyltransferase involved in cell wall biosynthesis